MGDPLPKTISESEYFWFLRHIWWKLHAPYNKHFAAVVCSESGAGKSYDTLSCASALYPDFKVSESVAFSARDFAKISNEHHPAAFPLILDDAGLAAFSGDALTKEVGKISKLAQSIRHKNWQVYLNLPNLDLLAKSVRITNHYYLEPVWIDFDTSLCYTKFQRIKINPKGGEKMIFKAPRKWVKILNPVTGYLQEKKQVFTTVPIPHPRMDIAKEYEKIRKDEMQTFRTDTTQELEKKHFEKLENKISSTQAIQIVQSNPKHFIGSDGLFSKAILQNKFKLAPSTIDKLKKSLDSQLGLTETVLLE